MRFVWDDAKERSNRAKHGVSFVEARQLLESADDYLEIFDAEHSESEDRIIAIGAIDRGVVVVVYVESEEDLIRIISARLANRREREAYYARRDPQT